MVTIRFEAELYTINGWTLFRLPKDVSVQLPSRGQVMVKGTINDIPFESPLEPDGDWSHWMRVDENIQNVIEAKAGGMVSLTIEPTKIWPEPEVPPDLLSALEAHPKAQEVWNKATPMAHWEWVRWIRSTARDETRKKRIEVASSKLAAGERRPCCWNRMLCTEPTVSKNGVLLQLHPSSS